MEILRQHIRLNYFYSQETKTIKKSCPVFAKIELKGSFFQECKMSSINCPKHVGKSCPKNCFLGNQKKIIHRIYILHPLIHNSTNVHFPFCKNPILFLVCLPSSKKYMVPLCNGLKLLSKEHFCFKQLQFHSIYIPILVYTVHIINVPQISKRKC